jgi:sulfide:quinone oxidoreductase
VPGLDEFGQSLWKTPEMQRVGSSFHRVLDLARSGKRATTLFVVTQDNKWPGPAYELAWMFDTWLRRRNVRKSVDIGFLTAEPGALSLLGSKVQRLAEQEFVGRGIGTQTGMTVRRVESNSAHFLGPAGEEIEREFDALVASPAYVSSVRYESLPSDERGFVLTDGSGSQRVRGWSNVYVAGDAGDFPVKQGSLAAYQSVAAAEAVAAEISGGRARYSFDPVLVAALEEFDKALYVQAPLASTGDSSAPVGIRPGRESSYRAATGYVWRLPKMSLAVYFPYRYRRGLPSHTGMQFTGIQQGRKLMARVLAR